jgi:hypothetical protein
MARARMLSATISESKKFGHVENNTNRLVYLMLLPWVDREGRYEADTTLISHRVLMRCGITEEQVEQALTDLHRCGLIYLYSAQGKRVLEFVDFLKWNKPHWKEPESMLPARDGASVTQSRNVDPSMGEEQPKVTPTLRQAPTAERKEREVKGKEEEPPLPPQEPPPQDDEEERSITLANKRRANKHTTALLAQQHPIAKNALDDLQSVYSWKPAQYAVVADTFLELVRDHGEARVAAAATHVLASGATITHPIPYLKKLLSDTPPAAAPAKPRHDLDAIFTYNERPVN